MYLCHSENLMPKDTKSLGNNKAPACESRGFVLKKKKVRILTHLLLFVIPKRFERLTHALEGRCSIQLSYGTSLIFGCKGSAFYENSKTFWNFFIHIFLWCYESVFYERSFFYLIRWGLNSCFIDKQMNSIFSGS